MRRIALLAVFCAGALPAEEPRRVLRVCADPDNLPFSNEKAEGFENRIAEQLARDLGMELQYFWWAQRRGYVRHTLGANACDLLISAPVGFAGALLTAPYYRSTYAFVTRTADRLQLHNLDAPELRRLRVGVQLIGEGSIDTPPAYLLTARGVVDNLRRYRVTGKDSKPNPPARIVEAVAASEVDVAIVWGPLAGYFATRQTVPLRVEPLPEDAGTAAIPVAFGIALAVRPDDTELRDRLQAALDRKQAAIVRVLTSYGVPLLPAKERP